MLCFKNFFLGTLILSSSTVFANTVDLSSASDPCQSKAARKEIIEKAFGKAQSNDKVVLDKASKEKLLVDLAKIIAATKPEITEAEKARMRETVKDLVCTRKAQESLGDGSTLNRMRMTLLNEVNNGEASPELLQAIEREFQDWLIDEEVKIEQVDEVDRSSFIQTAAKRLRTVLKNSNTISGDDMASLDMVLTRYRGLSFTSDNMRVGWQYDTEKDPKTGEEFVVAYHSLFRGNSCMGYSPVGRITEMPSFKISMKHFDRSRIHSWIKTVNYGSDGGEGMTEASRVPVKLLDFDHSCPSKGTSGTVTDSKKPSTNKPANH